VGIHVPTPGINGAALASFFASAEGTLFSMFNMFSMNHRFKLMGDFNLMATALKQYQAEHENTLPAADDGLQALVDASLLEVLPLDPWGKDYFFDTDYNIDSEWVVVIGSFGQNGVGQNVYDSDDVVEVLTWQE